MEIQLDDQKQNKFALHVYFGMRLLVALSVFGFIIFGDWESAINAVLILCLMLVPSLLKRQYRLYLPFELDLAIVGFIFLSLFLGSLSNFYERFSFWDDVLHFQSGLLLGVVGFVMVYILNARKSDKLTMSPGFVSIFAVCFSLALAVTWEVYEYIADYWFGYNMQDGGLADTMSDLIFNAIGAIIVAVIGYFWMRRRQKLPFAPRILRKFSLK